MTVSRSGAECRERADAGVVRAGLRVLDDDVPRVIDRDVRRLPAGELNGSVLRDDQS